jgi:DNA-binding NtrC family response regulator
MLRELQVFTSGAPAMRHLYERLERAARANISVLLLGETGVGKEVLAESLHQRSPRAQRSFLPVSDAEISESLFLRGRVVWL